MKVKSLMKVLLGKCKKRLLSKFESEKKIRKRSEIWNNKRSFENSKKAVRKLKKKG